MTTNNTTPPAPVLEHAELRRLAEAANVDNAWPFNVNVFRKTLTPSTVIALLDELASLRASAVAANGEPVVLSEGQLADVDRAVRILRANGYPGEANDLADVRACLVDATAPIPSDVPGEATTDPEA